MEALLTWWPVDLPSDIAFVALYTCLGVPALVGLWWSSRLVSRYRDVYRGGHAVNRPAWTTTMVCALVVVVLVVVLGCFRIGRGIVFAVPDRTLMFETVAFVIAALPPLWAGRIQPTLPLRQRLILVTLPVGSPGNPYATSTAFVGRFQDERAECVAGINAKNLESPRRISRPTDRQ